MPRTKRALRESDIEKYLVDECEKIGALCEKFTSPNRRSVPDRLITYDSIVAFVEVKAPGQKPTSAQTRDHNKRREQGAHVYWLDSKEAVDAIVVELLRAYPESFGAGLRKDSTNGLLGNGR